MSDRGADGIDAAFALTGPKRASGHEDGDERAVVDGRVFASSPLSPAMSLPSPSFTSVGDAAASAALRRRIHVALWRWCEAAGLHTVLVLDAGARFCPNGRAALKRALWALDRASETDWDVCFLAARPPFEHHQLQPFGFRPTLEARHDEFGFRPTLEARHELLDAERAYLVRPRSALLHVASDDACASMDGLLERLQRDGRCWYHRPPLCS
ncbi:Hypothetical protein UVM_LOCUS320 [uncultured virus]|nr:Hypothetical protein UVM_LOCUS320 [uncultured virus]